MVVCRGRPRKARMDRAGAGLVKEKELLGQGSELRRCVMEDAGMVQRLTELLPEIMANMDGED
ncbi:hypothetical protein Dimus_033572, partial [Dionaea muscipula]